MDEKPKLKIVEQRATPEIRNFWKCCPLKNEYLPESPCNKGKPELSKNGKTLEEPPCVWWINSEEHNYCFWRYIKDKSGPDGVMKELVQSELANLFGWSNTKTHFMLKQAMTELTEALKIYGAVELLQEIDSDTLESMMPIEDYLDPRDDVE